MGGSAGGKNLDELIANMEPVLHEGEYVFVTVKDIDTIPRALTICEVKEKEGITVILSKTEANRLNLPFNFVAAWITLTVHSALDAVGLTAAFSTALAEHNMSCNVVAGYYHDHIFVDVKDKERAMEVLSNMSSTTRPK